MIWDGGPAAQQAIHFSLFTIMQASLRSEGHGVPAKGLTGTGYEGHYFWDTETYVLPFLIHTSPDIARSLLMHRVRMLPDARRRAREVGCAGALFPWRTINGEEASAYYAAGTAQYHIDADIAYALDYYVRVTGDTDLLYRHGAELLVETARMWAGLGFFSERHDGKFVIHKVTGPDEYSTVVDNNLYTNLMAAENLRLAADSVDQVRTESPTDYRLLARSHRADRRRGEHVAPGGRADLRALRRRGRCPPPRRHLPRPSALGLPGTPPEQFPLLLHYHPLVIYRHQVIKQADVVLATVMLPERFTRRRAPPDLRLLRPTHHRRLVTVRMHPSDRRSRRRQVPQRRGVPRRCRSDRHGRHRGQPPRRRPRRFGRRHVDGSGLRLRRVPVEGGGTAVLADPAQPGPPTSSPAPPTRIATRRRHRGRSSHVPGEERRTLTAHHNEQLFTASTGPPRRSPAGTAHATPPRPDGQRTRVKPGSRRSPGWQ